MNDGRILTGTVLLGLIALNKAINGSRGLMHERGDRRAVAQLDGLAAMGDTVEEAIARLGSNLYERERKGRSDVDDDAYESAWTQISTGLLDKNPELDPEAVNAMYERFVNKLSNA